MTRSIDMISHQLLYKMDAVSDICPREKNMVLDSAHKK